MIKTGKGKTQATTVVHEGKVYRGTMPNLNMKTDLTDSFEYIATIVEGMSSGNMNGNPVFDDFKQKIIESTIAGEVGKLINERGHVPDNYVPSPHLGRYSSQVAIARGPSNLDVSSVSKPKTEPRPLPNFPANILPATEVLANNIAAKQQKEVELLDEAIHIDIGRREMLDRSSPTMLELMELFDAWEADHPFAKRQNELPEKRLKRIERELKKISETEKDVERQKRVEKLAERIHATVGKGTKKRKTKKKVSKKKTKKKTKKKVAKKRRNNK